MSPVSRKGAKHFSFKRNAKYRLPGCIKERYQDKYFLIFFSKKIYVVGTH